MRKTANFSFIVVQPITKADKTNLDFFLRRQEKQIVKEQKADTVSY